MINKFLNVCIFTNQKILIFFDCFFLFLIVFGITFAINYNANVRILIRNMQILSNIFSIFCEFFFVIFIIK